MIIPVLPVKNYFNQMGRVFVFVHKMQSITTPGRFVHGILLFGNTDVSMQHENKNSTDTVGMFTNQQLFDYH